MTPPLVNALHLEVTPIASPPSFANLLTQLRSRRGLVALDSAGGEPARWSWLAFEPRVEQRALPTDLTEFADYIRIGVTPLESDVPGPFAGGFLGALSYDMGVHGEGLELPSDAWNAPRVVGGIYTDFFVFDHERESLHLVLDAATSTERRDELLELVRRAEQSNETPFETIGALQRQVQSAEHRQRIERVREKIAAGEIYQANLAHAFEAHTRGDPLDLYLRLRRTNPAPYMAFMRFDTSAGAGTGALLSASPELLLEVVDGHAHTRPIKGTAARSTDSEEDRLRARALLESAKDRAELAMIVDLERNDLGRVARAGTVQARGFPTLRSYPGVHHLMADVDAELAPERTALDALLAMFPGGSITGAPKLRAMEVIAELEGAGRGFFTGSLGFLDSRGNACFNILIRTLEWRAETERGPKAGRVRYHVGGGITWGSNAEDEERETLLKGAKLAQSLGHSSGLAS